MRRWRREITIEGLNLERLIRQAGQSGLNITGIRRMSHRCVAGLIPEDCLPAFTELAQKGGWRIMPGKRVGAGRVYDCMRKRGLLIAALAIAGIVCAVSTQVMWRIDVIGAGTYEADVYSALSEMQVRVPALRQSVNLRMIRDELEWRYPHVAWVECGWRGMTLTLRFVEGILPETAAAQGPCDIVASRDGIISSIVTRAGTPVVEPGQLVRKGDVLIVGEERTSAGSTRAVAARGSVYARVWDAASVRMSLKQVDTIYSGRSQTVYTLRTPWFDLWPMPPSEYAEQDVSVTETQLSNWMLPVTLRIETRYEAGHVLNMAGVSEIREAAADAAKRKLLEKVGDSQSLVDIWVNWSMIEDEILLSVAYGERLMDIAQQEREPVMAAAGQRTQTE